MNAAGRSFFPTLIRDQRHLSSVSGKAFSKSQEVSEDDERAGGGGSFQRGREDGMA